MQRANCLVVRPARPHLVVTGAIIAVLVPVLAHAQVSGIGYSITPMVEYVRFADDAALDDGLMLGGRVGFSFGEFIELNGLYLLDGEVKTDFAGFDGGFDAATNQRFAMLPSRGVEVSRYGGQVKLNFGRGGLFPFATLGTGVLAFEPDALKRSETVYLNGGVGLQYSVKDRYTLVLKANSLNYRYNPASTLLSAEDLAFLGLLPEDFSLQTVNNFSASAGMQFYLGGRTAGELSEVDQALQRQFARGWRGVPLRVEPVAANVNFSGPLGYRSDQRFVGAGVGIDLGAVAGIRGFYWRGTEAGKWTDFDKLEAFGGELQLAFGEAVGLTPFFTLGGGFMNVKQGYEGNGQAAPDDRPFAIGGVGLILPVNQSVSFVGGARSLLMSTAGVDNVSDAGDVLGNTMFSVALSFGVGGGRGDGETPVFGRELESARSERVQLRKELARAQSRIDSLAALAASGQAPAAAKEPAAKEAAVAAKEAAVAAKEAAPKAGKAAPATAAAPAPATGPAGERWMSVPVPEEGEIYVRFGKPGGVSVETVEGDAVNYYYDPASGALMLTPPGAAGAPAGPGGAAAPMPATPSQIQDMIRAALRAERQQAPGTGQAAADSVVDRLEQMLERRFGEMDAELESLRAQARQRAPEAPAAPAPAAEPRPAPAVDLTPAPAPAPAAEPKAVERQPAERRAPAEPQPAPRPQPPGSDSAAKTLRPPRGEREGAVPRGDFEGAAFLGGYNFNEPHQGLFGFRTEYRLTGRSFVVVPEAVFGFGDGDKTSTVNLNAVRRWSSERFDRYLPFAGAGVGLQHRNATKGVFNLIAGVERPFSTGSVSIEYVTQNFFDNNRFLLGYRFEL